MAEGSNELFPSLCVCRLSSVNFLHLICSRTTRSNWTTLWCDTLWMPRSKCRSLLMTSRDGYQVMIIPLITLKVSSSFKHTLINTWKTQHTLKFVDQLNAWVNFFLSCRFNANIHLYSSSVSFYILISSLKPQDQLCSNMVGVSIS
jgi:hypothetical protein